MDNQNYYSVAFKYKHAIRGVSGGWIHISYFVDERKESDRLSAALDKVCNALDALNLDHRHEYCWPDGSLLRYIKTDFGIIELTFALMSKLRGMEFEIHPLNPWEIERPWEDEKETIAQVFDRRLSEKAHRKKSLIQFVAKAVMAEA